MIKDSLVNWPWNAPSYTGWAILKQKGFFSRRPEEKAARECARLERIYELESMSDFERDLVQVTG